MGRTLDARRAAAHRPGGRMILRPGRTPGGVRRTGCPRWTIGRRRLPRDTAHYLVQEAAGTGGTTPLPGPDATGGIAMSSASGKVALVTGSTALGCGSACHDAGGVRDYVGYGTANDFETAAAPGLTNTTTDLRAGDGAADTDNNAADFTAGAPDPRSLGGGGTTTPPPPSARIHDIQGAAHRSSLAGKAVTAVPGIVTAVTSGGFWMQDPEADDNPATSEGLYVYTSSRPTVARGDSVAVSGRVSEYRSGGSSSANLTTTEITGPAVLAHDQSLPEPTLVGPVRSGPVGSGPGPAWVGFGAVRAGRGAAG